jgi:hypothetical protein
MALQFAARRNLETLDANADETLGAMLLISAATMLQRAPEQDAKPLYIKPARPAGQENHD